ncbi:MAG: hypothetical protein JNL60_09620 [Bacteroidia bacterium]|nr:hypothetical protein [Bacteroidia bacterium]
MKYSTLKIVLLAMLFFCGTTFTAQTDQKPYPEKFTIKQKEVDKLFSYNPGTRLSARGNKYLAKGTVLVNTSNGDTKYLRYQLNYFKSAFLNVQVNGAFSTQMFIVSDDKSVFYKGRLEKGKWLMKKCDEDEIVSE